MLLCLLDFLSWKDNMTRALLNLLSFWRYMSSLLESDLFFSKVTSQSEGLRQKRMKHSETMQKCAKKLSTTKTTFDNLTYPTSLRMDAASALKAAASWRKRSNIDGMLKHIFQVFEQAEEGLTTRKITWNAEKASQRPLRTKWSFHAWPIRKCTFRTIFACPLLPLWCRVLPM